MTISDEELLISRPPQSQQRKPASRLGPPQSIRIECQAEERHFIDSPSLKINASVRPIRFTTNDQVKPDQYRSEIIVQNNPDVDFYIKRLRVAFHAQDDLAINTTPKNQRPSSQQKPRQNQGKYRSNSLPRSHSDALLHQWIDDICSNEKLMADDDICFFIKNGEFLARI